MFTDCTTRYNWRYFKGTANDLIVKITNIFRTMLKQPSAKYSGRTLKETLYFLKQATEQYITIFNLLQNSQRRIRNFLKQLFKQITLIQQVDNWNQKWRMQLMSTHLEDRIILIFLQKIKKQIPENFNYNILNQGQNIQSYLMEIKQIKQTIMRELLKNQSFEIVKMFARGRSILNMKSKEIIDNGRIILANKLKTGVRYTEYKELYWYMDKELANWKHLMQKQMSDLLDNQGNDSDADEIRVKLSYYMKIQNEGFALQTCNLLMEYYQMRCRMIAEYLNIKLVNKLIWKMKQHQKYNNLFIQFGQSILCKIQNLNYTFSFQTQDKLYIKNYNKIWRGKHQKQSSLMYDKHIQLIRYLIMAKMSGITEYLSVDVIEPNQKFIFVMQKGQINFQSFANGITYFRTLTLAGKLKYILDISQGLINLHAHGINHYDITFRNTICVNGKYKIIDFDVARMVRCEIDELDDQNQKIEEMKKIRNVVIANTNLLMKKQLQSEKIITEKSSRTNGSIQNINRLSEYSKLKNIVELHELFKQQQNFMSPQEWKGKQVRYKLIVQYQSLIVGKRDCNKFALLMLKLLFTGNIKTELTKMDKEIVSFLLEVQQNQEINYNKYRDAFQFDPSVSNQKNKQILKLLAQLLRSKLSDRIPMKLFLFKFMKIFRISKYPFNFDEFTNNHKKQNKQIIQYVNRVILNRRPQKYISQIQMVKPRQRQQQLISKQIEQQPFVFKQRNPYKTICDIFQSTRRKKELHQQQIRQMQSSLNFDVEPNYQFYNQVSINEEMLNNLCDHIQKVVARVKPFLLGQSWNQFKLKKQSNKCYLHQQPYQFYICLDQNIQKQYCQQCIQKQFNQVKMGTTKINKYSQVYHIHSQSPIIAKMVYLNMDCQFICHQCGQELSHSFYQQLSQMLFVDNQNRQILDMICFQKQCGKTPMLWGSRTKKNHSHFHTKISTRKAINRLNYDVDKNKIEEYRQRLRYISQRSQQAEAQIQQYYSMLYQEINQISKLKQIKSMFECLNQLNTYMSTSSQANSQQRLNQLYIGQNLDRLLLSVSSILEKSQQLFTAIYQKMLQSKQERSSIVVPSNLLVNYYEDFKKLREKINMFGNYRYPIKIYQKQIRQVDDSEQNNLLMFQNMTKNIIERKYIADKVGLIRRKQNQQKQFQDNKQDNQQAGNQKQQNILKTHQQQNILKNKQQQNILKSNQQKQQKSIKNQREMPQKYLNDKQENQIQIRIIWQQSIISSNNILSKFIDFQHSKYLQFQNQKQGSFNYPIQLNKINWDKCQSQNLNKNISSLQQINSFELESSDQFLSFLKRQMDDQLLQINQCKSSIQLKGLIQSFENMLKNKKLNVPRQQLQKAKLNGWQQFQIINQLQDLTHKKKIIQGILLNHKHERIILSDIHEEQFKWNQLVKSIVESCQNQQQNILQSLIFNQIKLMVINQRKDDYATFATFLHKLSENSDLFIATLEYSNQKYIQLLRKIIKQINQLYNQLFSFISKMQIVSLEPLKPSQKLELMSTYSHLKYPNNDNNNQPLLSITKRHTKYVNIIQINEQYQELSQQKQYKLTKQQIDLNILKWKRQGYLQIEITLFQKCICFKNDYKFYNFDRFSNLEQLTIINKPKLNIVFKSMAIQQLLKQCKQLKQITIKCLNGFDHKCVQLLNQLNHCSLQLYSYSEQAKQLMVESQAFKNDFHKIVPLQIEPQLINIGKYPFKIYGADFLVDLRMNNINQILQNSQQTVSYRLKLLVNKFHNKEIDFALLSEMFWNRNKNSRIFLNLQEKIQIKYQNMTILINLSQKKFSQINYLILEGVIIANQINQKQQAVQQSILNLLKKNNLIALEFKKCFGIQLQAIFQNSKTLKKLFIEQSVFSYQNNQIFKTKLQLQTLLLTKSGYFSAGGQNYNTISLSSFFNNKDIDIRITKYLFINDYRMQQKQIDWIFKNQQIQQISLSGCLRLSNSIIDRFEKMKNLSILNVTNTGITLESKNEFKRSYQLINSKLTKQNYKQNQSLYLQQLKRIAQQMNIQELLYPKQLYHTYKSQNQIINYIKSFQLCSSLQINQVQFAEWKNITNLTIKNIHYTSKQKYYFLDLLSTLPKLQTIQLQNVLWNNKNDKQELLYDFPYLSQLNNLNKLSMIDCQLKSLNFSYLQQYPRLQTLILRDNKLQIISKIKLYHLKQLDISFNNLRLLQECYFPKLVKIFVNSNNYQFGYFLKQQNTPQLKQIIVDQNQYQQINSIIKNSYSQTIQIVKMVKQQGSKIYSFHQRCSNSP